MPSRLRTEPGSGTRPPSIPERASTSGSALDQRYEEVLSQPSHAVLAGHARAILHRRVTVFLILSKRSGRPRCCSS